MKTYENKHGKLVVKAITGTVPVNTIFLKDIPEEAQFDLETAEKVVLITENRRSQIVVKSVHEKVALVIHESASTCWVAQIEFLEYNGDTSAREAIVKEQEYVSWDQIHSGLGQ